MCRLLRNLLQPEDILHVVEPGLLLHDPISGPQGAVGEGVAARRLVRQFHPLAAVEADADRALSEVGRGRTEELEVGDHRLEVDLAGVGLVHALSQGEEVVTTRGEERVGADLVRRSEVERLTGRGTESDEVVARRLETARTELAAQDEFDTVVVNDDVDRACDELVSLLVGPDAGPGPRS